jgi:hypothetical protein
MGLIHHDITEVEKIQINRSWHIPDTATDTKHIGFDCMDCIGPSLDIEIDFEEGNGIEEFLASEFGWNANRLSFVD